MTDQSVIVNRELAALARGSRVRTTCRGGSGDAAASM